MKGAVVKRPKSNMTNSTSTTVVNRDEFDHVIIERLKEYSLATFERAFNSVNDGLKPVARRILYTMYKEHLTKEFKKVQYVSGATMKYHPYNSDTIADAVTQLGQWFVKNYPFLDTQGNFGTTKNLKGYAAPRYIECRLSKFAVDCITSDIDSNCIPYEPNYDNTNDEPVYLPTKVPLTLVQGFQGIGEAYKAFVPPYNLEEVVNACIKVIRNKNIPLSVLAKELHPDFPTGGVIINKSEIERFQSLSADTVEKMSRNGENIEIKYRAKIEIDREHSIIRIMDMPFGVSFDTVWDEILYEANNKGNVILAGIYNKSDYEFPKKSGNIVNELICRKDANLLEIVDQLYAKTSLETKMTLSYLLYCGKYVERVSIKGIILNWYKIQSMIIRRKLNYAISDLQNRIHILEGLVIVYDRMDEVIKTIKEVSSTDNNVCIETLRKKFKLTFVQAKGISEMQLRQLTRASKPALLTKIDTMRKDIIGYENRLDNIDDEIIKNLEYMKANYSRPRRTELVDIDKVEKDKKCVNMSHGALIYTRDCVGLFDSSVLLNKLNLSNLKPIKIDGRNVKEIIGFSEITNNVAGTIIFSSDGTARRTKVSEIPVSNFWINTNPSGAMINCAIPLYESESKDSLVVTVNADSKVKFFNSLEIGFKKVNTGVIVAAAPITNLAKLKGIMIYNKEGQYLYIDKCEIPTLSRTSAGNSLSIGGSKIRIIPIYEQEIGCNVFIPMIKSKENGTNVFTAMKETDIPMLKRTNKPKMLVDLKSYEFMGLGVINSDLKNKGTLTFIGSDGTSTTIGKFIKENMEVKKITGCDPIGCILM